jgi:hypothetical protein
VKAAASWQKVNAHTSWSDVPPMMIHFPCEMMMMIQRDFKIPSHFCTHRVVRYHTGRVCCILLKARELDHIRVSYYRTTCRPDRELEEQNRSLSQKDIATAPHINSDLPINRRQGGPIKHSEMSWGLKVSLLF